MTTVRTTFHRSEGVQPPGLDEALFAEGYAEFYSGPVQASRLAFTIHKAGLGILVHDDEGHHVGTFADPTRAVAHGFDRFDRPRPRRAKRRSVGEPQP